MHRFLTALGVFAVASIALAEPPPTPAPDPAKDKPAEKKPDGDSPAPVVTAHTLTLPGGKTIAYHATAGYLTLRDLNEPRDSRPKSDKEDAVDPIKGKPKAQVFFVAYTLDGVADAATRPIMFSFNGGPGASSVWLHLGALGPRRAQLTPLGEAPPPPYKVVDNESTWLDRTDLVFIDPVSTGYSRAAAGEGSNQFHGYREDLASVGEFIRLYLTHHARWASPKFIVGESYGTTRAAALSEYLQDKHGIYLNGITLVSAVLDFQTLSFQPGNDLPYALFLPTYTAAAWYHQRLPADLQAKPLAEVAKEAEAFAAGEYPLALARGSALPDADRQRVAAGLSRLTGLPATYLAQVNLREPADKFFADLLKDKNRGIGRYDARYTGIRYAPGTTDDDFDPSFEAVNGPFTAAFNDYIRRELKYESDLPYNLLTDVSPWNWSTVQNQYLNVADDLHKAINRHPYLQVWVCCGYYDLATPYFAAEHTLNSMNLDPSVRGNVRVTYYESGHMLYTHQPSREKLKTDFDAFIENALHVAPISTAQP